MRSVLIVVLFEWGLLLSSCAGIRGGSSSLPVLMVQRLDWMDEVAEAKRAKGLPIADPKREAELLNAMMQRGTAAGLPAQKVRLFFSGQIQAAKVRQEEWLRQHPAASGGKAPDLATTIRPALDQIGRKMIERLAQETQEICSSDALLIEKETRERLAKAGYTETVAQPALQGLIAALRRTAHEPIPAKPQATPTTSRR